MHRSGTSATGGVLSLMGLEFGSELTKPSEKENPKGFFENTFVQLLNKKIFSENNSSWDDYTFDIDNIEKKDIDKYIKEAKNILKDEFQYVENFAIKDPRICLLFPIWEQACFDMGIEIKIIIPYRNPLEVAASLKKRNGFSYEFSFILWMKYFLLSENYSRKYNRIFISFDDLIDKTSITLKEILGFLDIDLSKKMQENIADFLDKNIKHNNIPIKNFSKDSTLLLQDIFKLIEIKKFEDKNKFDSMRKDFYHQLNLFNNKELKNKHLIMLEKIEQVQEEKTNLNTKFKNIEKLAQERKEKIEKSQEQIERLQEEKRGINEKFKHAEFIARKRKKDIEKIQSEKNNLSLKLKNTESVLIEEKYKLQEQQNGMKQLSKQNNELLNDFIEIKEKRISRFINPIRFIKNIKGEI